MRLIDADKLENDITDNITVKAVSRMLAITQGQPTVQAIPLDKPFCKMVYGDYVCYNRNWLMKHLTMELDILRGKGRWIDVNGDGSLWRCSVCGELQCCESNYCGDCGAKMEKENEID